MNGVAAAALDAQVAFDGDVLQSDAAFAYRSGNDHVAFNGAVSYRGSGGDGQIRLRWQYAVLHPLQHGYGFSAGQSFGRQEAAVLVAAQVTGLGCRAHCALGPIGDGVAVGEAFCRQAVVSQAFGFGDKGRRLGAGDGLCRTEGAVFITADIALAHSQGQFTVEPIVSGNVAEIHRAAVLGINGCID